MLSFIVVIVSNVNPYLHTAVYSVYQSETVLRAESLNSVSTMKDTRMLQDRESGSQPLSPLSIFFVVAIPFFVSITDRMIPASRPYIKLVRANRIFIPIPYALIDVSWGGAIMIVIHIIFAIAVGASSYTSLQSAGESYDRSIVIATGQVTVMHYWLVLLTSAKCRIILIDGSEANGAPFDRGIKFHQAVGVLTVISSVIHLSCYASRPMAEVFSSSYEGEAIPVYGYVAFIFTCLMAWTAIEPFRRLKYEIFQRVHHLYIFVVVFICLHAESAILGFIPGIIWHGIDNFQKIYAYFSVKKLVLAICSKGPTDILTIRVPIDKNNIKAPGLGSYYFLHFPEVSKVEWHPFSVSGYDAPSSTVTFNIKAMEKGSFTRNFFDYVDNISSSSILSDDDRVPVSMHKHRIALNGPFGSLSVDLELYNHIIIVAGGIGITPMWLILDDIVKYINSRSVSQVSLDQVSPETVESKKRRKVYTYQNLRKVTLIWSYRGDNMTTLFSNNILNENTFSSTKALAKPYSLNITSKDVPRQNVSFEYLFYDTYQSKTSSKHSNSSIETAVGNTHILGNVNYENGRPNISRLITSYNNQKWLGDTCIVACGPYNLIRDVKEEAARHRIDIHVENFEL